MMKDSASICFFMEYLGEGILRLFSIPTTLWLLESTLLRSWRGFVEAAIEQQSDKEGFFPLTISIIFSIIESIATKPRHIAQDAKDKIAILFMATIDKVARSWIGSEIGSSKSNRRCTECLFLHFVELCRKKNEIEPTCQDTNHFRRCLIKVWKKPISKNINFFASSHMFCRRKIGTIDVFCRRDQCLINVRLPSNLIWHYLICASWNKIYVFSFWDLHTNCILILLVRNDKSDMLAFALQV